MIALITPISAVKLRFYSFMLNRIILLACFIPLIYACTPDEEIFRELEDDSLYFSTDTLHFDTLLTTQLSPSYRVFLHNPNKGGVIVPSIALRDANTPFTLTINGLTSTSFTNIKVIGKDSLLILINGTLPLSQTQEPLLVRDYLEVGGSSQPFLVVEAWGQDASFLHDLVITGEEVWDSPIPYVVRGAVLVDTLSKLTIQAGVTVIMEPTANFFVKGCLLTEGEPDRQIIFRNARTDTNYREAPGQWGAIYFLEGSKGNRLNHTVIKNGEIGLYVGTPDEDDEPDVTISNCMIANMSSDGILAYTSDVHVFNTVIYNAGRYLAGNLAGGSYRYEHCTLSNFPNDFFRENAAVVFSDFVVLADNTVLTAPLNVSVYNSVIWGAEKEEVEILTDGGSAFAYQFRNNLMKSNNSLLNGNGNILNTAPEFVDEFAYDYRPDSLSPLIDAGAARNIDFDFLGKPRNGLPDIGAYEWKEKTEDEG